MLVILKRDNEEVNEQAAQLIAGAIKKKPALTLGLATGNTMVGLYKHLVRLHQASSLDFSYVTTFNLDEYLGLPAAHPQSFRHFMQENFFRHVNVPARNIHIPDRKSTRLNSSHSQISYAVFCLKKKNTD